MNMLEMKNSLTRFPRVKMVVAVGPNGELGFGGDLIYRDPEDMKLFKAATIHAPVVMGRKTWDSLPRKPLPYRSNYVLSSQTPAEQDHGALWFDSPGRLVNALSDTPVIFIIGGAALYEMFLPVTDEIILSQFREAREADVYFKSLNQLLDLGFRSESGRDYGAFSHHHLIRKEGAEYDL